MDHIILITSNITLTKPIGIFFLKTIAHVSYQSALLTQHQLCPFNRLFKRQTVRVPDYVIPVVQRTPVSRQRNECLNKSLQTDRAVINAKLNYFVH